MKTILLILIIPCLAFAENPFHNEFMPGVRIKPESTAIERKFNAEADLLELQYARELYRGIMPGTRAQDIDNPVYKNMPNYYPSDSIIILQSQEGSPEIPAQDLHRVFPIDKLH